MAQKFLNGIDISGNIVVDSNSAVGATVLDIQGTQGQLFSLTNSLSGDLFSVSDISGIPILTVNSSGAITIDGTLTSNGQITGTELEGTSLDINGAADISGALTVHGNINIDNDLTVSGGDISLGGTGRIQGIDTVSASTDAANKAYVDGAVIANTDTQDLSISGQT